jgi:hypothetical protein
MAPPRSEKRRYCMGAKGAHSRWGSYIFLTSSPMLLIFSQRTVGTSFTSYRILSLQNFADGQEGRAPHWSGPELVASGETG